MNIPPVVFPGIGKIQTYIVPVSGYYSIVAAGAQGGPGGDCGGKGARIQELSRCLRTRFCKSSSD